MPHHFPIHVMSAEQTGMDRNVPEPLGATGSTERAPRSPNGMPRQHPEDHFGRGPRRDLVDQCSAYACTMRAHARPPRRTTSTCRSPRTRSSAAALHRAHSAYACVCRADKAPRKIPEKLGSSTRVPARTRWSQRCAYAKEREEPEQLVAGVHDDRAPSGYKPDITAGHGACPMQPRGRLPYSAHARIRWSPEKRRPGARCPQAAVIRRAAARQRGGHRGSGGRRSAGGPGWRSHASDTAQPAPRSMRPPRRSPGLGSGR